MMMKNNTQALVLLAHGSRDASWRAPFEAIAAQVASAQPGLQVRCAYLQLCQPDLPQVVADLCAAGYQKITVAPLFLGVGTHMRDDIPALLAAVQSQQPGCCFTLLPTLGEDAAAQNWMANWVLARL